MSAATGMAAYDRELNYRRQNGTERLTPRQERQVSRKIRRHIARARFVMNAPQFEAAVEAERETVRTRLLGQVKVQLYPDTAGRMNGRAVMLVQEDEVTKWA